MSSPTTQLDNAKFYVSQHLSDLCSQILAVDTGEPMVMGSRLAILCNMLYPLKASNTLSLAKDIVADAAMREIAELAR